MIWDLVLRLAGQLRVCAVPGPQGAPDLRILGFDFNAAFSMAAALGVPAVAVAEFLPAIEAAAVRAMNNASQGTFVDG